MCPIKITGPGAVAQPAPLPLAPARTDERPAVGHPGDSFVVVGGREAGSHGGAPPAVGTAGSTSTIPPRALPPLEQALADPSIVALDPGMRTPPPELLDELRRAQRILIVGHTIPKPDGDCGGSVLGLGRALRALGKEVDLCVDEIFPGGVRAIDAAEEIGTWPAVAGKDYDLVVMVDVSEVGRIGRASEAVAAAKSLIVVDHHNVDPTRAQFPVGPETPVRVWVDKTSPAAALQVAAIATHRGGERFSSEQWRAIALPCLAGIGTDTGFFRFEGIELEALQQFKGLLHNRLQAGLPAVQAAVRYDLPAFAASLLGLPPQPTDLRGIAAEAVRAQLVELAAAGRTMHAEVAPSGTLAMLFVPEPFARLATEAAQLEDPRANVGDIEANIKWGPLAQLKKQHPVAVCLTETGSRIAVEVRSQEAGPAYELAMALGGGGHPRAAGARIDGSLAEARAKVLAWLEQWELANAARLRAPR